MLSSKDTDDELHESLIMALDTDAIINNTEDDSVDNEQNVDVKHKSPARLVTVEPVILLYFIAIGCALSVQEEYVFSYYSKKYNLLSNSSDSCIENKSDTEYQTRDHVEKLTSSFLFNNILITCIPASILVLLLGSYSDKVGRKIAMLLPCIGMLGRITVYIIVVSLNYDVKYLFIGSALDACGGYVGALLMGAMAYIADVTSFKSRAVRIAIVEGCLGISSGLTQLGLGYFIKGTGFLWPLITSAIILALVILYIIFCVTETVTHVEKGKLFTLKHIMDTLVTFTKTTEPGRRKKLTIILLAVFMSAPISINRLDIQMMFQQATPLCWGSVKIGYFQAIQYWSLYMGAVIGIKLFKKCHVSDTNIALITCISGIIGQVYSSFVTNNTMMYLVPLVNNFGLTVPLLRSMASKVVSPDEQGAMFAGMACAETLCIPVGETLFLSIYSSTLDTFKGSVFLSMAGLYVITMLLLLSYKYLERKPIKQSTSINT